MLKDESKYNLLAGMWDADRKWFVETSSFGITSLRMNLDEPFPAKSLSTPHVFRSPLSKLKKISLLKDNNPLKVKLENKWLKLDAFSVPD